MERRRRPAALPPISRRELLRVGSLGLVGLSLPQLLAAAETDGLLRRGAAKSCILFFLEGGPAQQDMWDMKPKAPAEVRGPFRPIDTSVSGVQVCEYLPMLSQQMHQLAQVRSVHHDVVDHNASTYYMLTGRSPVVGNRLIVRDEPENFPPFGAVLAKLRPLRDLPEFVHLPEIMSNNGDEIPGERAGFLGAAFDPLVGGDPSERNYRIPGLSLPAHSPLSRLHRRRQLLEMLDKSPHVEPADAAVAGLSSHYQKAFSLLGTQKTRDAFDLAREKPSLRERYGLPDREDRSVEARKFGGLPHLGQCLLLARRLIEAGVRLVTVCTGRRIDQTWDGHRQHFSLLRKSILPYFDRAFSALLEDMSDRGLLEETLVVAMGEFGRTPKIGQITSGAGATAEGRDHWPHCYTILLAGAGIRGGYVYGSSDKEAAYPATDPVTPGDVAATIYHALGLDPHALIHDPAGRPHVLALGDPILPLFAS
ncbi:MAG: DUF1501 domain-containing protein [Planctomycetia bacterium]|nr:DUF1501 domain-containing protein [Planctomycetia bacterium]